MGAESRVLGHDRELAAIDAFLVTEYRAVVGDSSG
jgi:hypothetical protein